MKFKEYMHVEKLGSTETEGILDGACYIFPKLDGTNASIWIDDDGWRFNIPTVMAGSRKRELSADKDNAGFWQWATSHPVIKELLIRRRWRLYGEWLVPHTLRTYTDDAWRKFYVFDVEDEHGNLLHYKEYAQELELCGIDFICPFSVSYHPSLEESASWLDRSTFLIKEGKGAGEGIVIKNYDFTNRYGRKVWAKLVREDYKAAKNTGSKLKPRDNQDVESAIVNRYVGNAMVDKVHAKIANEMDGWSNRHIPRLLSTVYHDLVKEEMWDAIKNLKFPVVNFRTLNHLTTAKVKELRPDLF